MKSTTGQNGNLARAQKLKERGLTAEARKEVEEHLKHAPNDGHALHFLALLLYENNEFSDSLRLLQAAATALPGDAQIQNDLGGLYTKNEQLEEATQCFRRSIELRPSSAQSHYNLGYTFQVQGLLEQAEISYRTALDLAGKNAFMLCNLGGSLQEQGKTEQAIACYQAALTLDPQDVNSLNNLGYALQLSGKLSEATGYFEQAISLRPDFAGSYLNMGLVLFQRGELEKAEAAHRHALSLDPEFAEGYFALGITLAAMRRIPEAIECYNEMLTRRPERYMAYDNVLMTSQFVPTISAEQLAQAHFEYGRRYEAPFKPNWPRHGNVRDPQRRLRVGYVSADFRSHAVSYFIEPILRHHDRSQFETFCYYNHKQYDQVTERLMSLTGHWQSCLSMSDDQLAKKIRADEIDILIDLSGHTAGNRLQTFIRKPAPLQITYIGYLSTTGLSAMDYRLTDRLSEPAGSEKYYSEKLLYLPDTTWCYQPPYDSPNLTPLPALRNGHLTFGSLNSIDKIDAQSINLWAKLLHTIPTARMLILAVPEARSYYIEQFAAAGIDTSRLDFLGKLTPQQYREAIQRIDISLDSYPVNGATTTCESLWQGIPTLTLYGDRHLSRNGLSIMAAARLPDFAAATPDDLINTAVLLSNNLGILQNIRLGMREHLANTPLLDQRQFVLNLESIYRSIWVDWCNSPA